MLDPVRQSAAIPCRDGRVCLVTSRDGKRWVFPKGMIDPGHSASEAALIEAWEEAGLAGTLDAEALGTYVYEKYGADHLVLVYRMKVNEIRDDWPERELRQRGWVTIEDALARIEEPGLKEILLQNRGRLGTLD